MEILLGVIVVLLVVVVLLQIFYLRARRKPDLELRPLQVQLEAIERARSGRNAACARKLGEAATNPASKPFPTGRNSRPL